MNKSNSASKIKMKSFDRKVMAYLQTTSNPLEAKINAFFSVYIEGTSKLFTVILVLLKISRMIKSKCTFRFSGCS